VLNLQFKNLKNSFEGLTGVVKKPLEVASNSNDPVRILKGVGVGIVGVVVRPTTGILDFASQGFEEIRRCLFFF
jgi:vacuolar protein sorting-associated protein 13A/C